MFVKLELSPFEGNSVSNPSVLKIAQCWSMVVSRHYIVISYCKEDGCQKGMAWLLPILDDSVLNDIVFVNSKRTQCNYVFFSSFQGRGRGLSKGGYVEVLFTKIILIIYIYICSESELFNTNSNYVQILFHCQSSWLDSLHNFWWLVNWDLFKNPVVPAICCPFLKCLFINMVQLPVPMFNN